MIMWVKRTPNSNKPFERWLLASQWEWISMSKAFETWLEIVVISIVNANPLIKDTPRWKEREERYLKLISLWKDKMIPIRMLKDLVEMMQEHHEEKLDILWDMYMRFVSLWENGQFFTPPHIADMMAQMTDTKPWEWERVLDCACGSWTLLLWALKNNPRCRLYWVDLDRRCVMMALLNCYWYWWAWEFIVWNTLTNEYSEWWICSYWMIYEIDPDKFKEKIEEVKNTTHSVSPKPEQLKQVSLF